MPEIICNTSPLQYLHQIKILHLLPLLVKQVIVPPAVVNELAAGRAHKVDLPDPATIEWMRIRQPQSALALPLVTDLGRGEAEVLVLALESKDAVVVMDYLLGRKVAFSLGVKVTGTLGILLDAKKAGLIPLVQPFLDSLEALRFRISERTRTTILEMAGEVTQFT